ncbi:MAG: NlpC/P60 family protein [Vulcanimicrobiota bacterium]
MFAVQQPTTGYLDTLGGFGFPATQLPPGLGGFGAQQRLGSPSLTATSVNFGAIPDPGAAQMLALSQQTNQLLLGMMSLLLGLMANRAGSSAGSSPFSAFDSGSVSGGGGGGEVSGSSASSSTGNVSNGPKVANPKVQKLIDSALSKQGSPYVFGAAGPNKFDCSGLVSWALGQAGSNVGHMNARGLQAHYKNNKVSKEELQPGDLVFFWSPNDRGIPPGQASHVEIYLGNGMTMGTDNAKEGAKVEPINWSTFIGGARPPELQ